MNQHQLENGSIQPEKATGRGIETMDTQARIGKLRDEIITYAGSYVCDILCRHLDAIAEDLKVKENEYKNLVEGAAKLNKAKDEEVAEKDKKIEELLETIGELNYDINNLRDTPKQIAHLNKVIELMAEDTLHIRQILPLPIIRRRLISEAIEYFTQEAKGRITAEKKEKK